MAVPKRKKSRSRTRTRRAQWKAHGPALTEIHLDGRTVLAPRRLATAYRTGLLSS